MDKSITNLGRTKSTLRGLIYQLTFEKLEDLKNEKDLIKGHYEKIQESTSPSILEKLRILHKSLRDCPIPPTDTENIEPILENIEAILKCKDTSDSSSALISPQCLEHWIKKLESVIRNSVRRSEYSFLYGTVLSQSVDNTSPMDETGMEFEMLELETSCPDKIQTIQEMEKRFFTTGNGEYNDPKFLAFLQENIFKFSDDDDIELGTKFKNFMSATQRFGTESFIPDSEEIKSSIQCLIGDNLLPDDKKQTLRELIENSAALEEVRTLITSRLKSLKRWNWPGQWVQMDIRRDISGRYRAFMDEDLLTAIFLQFIGEKWSTHFRQHFVELYYHSSSATKPPFKNSIQTYRTEGHKKLFCGTLLNSGYADDNENLKQSNMNSPIESKHYLLHLLANEVRLNHVLRPDARFTAIHTDIEWFGPSLVHQSILTLLKFFNVPEDWLGFFEKFLKAPLKLKPTDEAPRIRTRGVPISHSLSQLFGESLMFVLDFYVKRATGIQLYRLYDDFMFWGHDGQKVIQAWEILNNYTHLINLKLNKDKSGIIRCQSGNELKTPGVTPIDDSQKVYPSISAELWEHGIRWGFLVMEKNGSFQIDQAQLIPYIEEMKIQLGKTRSILEWIKTYNKYIGFFTRNFGSNALVFGVEHINQMIEAFTFIQLQAFTGTNGNPVAELRNQFDILKDLDVLDAWVFWPLGFGGLGLKNPLLDFIASKEISEYEEPIEKDADNIFTYDDLPKHDLIAWRKVVEAQKEKKIQSAYDEDDEENEMSWKKRKAEPFSFEDYSSKRESHSRTWRTKFEKLMTKPTPKLPQLSSQSQNLFESLEMKNGTNAYNSWLFATYSHQIQDTFGTLNFINTKLIPVSMISSIMNTKLAF